MTVKLQSAYGFAVLMLLAVLSGCDSGDPCASGQRVVVNTVAPDTFRFALREELYPIVVADYFDVPDEHAGNMSYETSPRPSGDFWAASAGRGDTIRVKTLRADTADIRFISLTGCFAAADASFGRTLIVYDSSATSAQGQP